MALDVDRYFDRRRLTRALRFWRIAAIAALVGLIAVAVGRSDAVPRASVALIEVHNVIFDDTDRIETLDDIADDDRIKALLVHIDSPGGTVVGGENLYLALRRVAEKKPVVAVMAELATSAGYMVALGTDRIVARQGTVTGSIGVLMQSVEITDMLAKLGITADSIKSAPLKATPNPLEKLTPDARSAAEDVVMDMYNMFVDMVSERRGMDRDATLKLADGRVYTGRQAIQNGLIDEIGGEREARAWLKSAHNIDDRLPISLVEVRRDKGFLTGLLDDLMGKALFSERLRLDGLISLWHPQLH
ncbi:MAG: putative peptidase family [Rhodospirillales bacterium]|jgi:protease-4|nr:putative peptidase family [Rhodospirillales bacterium]